MKRVLLINGGPLDYGGITTYMMNYQRHIDPERVHFDFVVHGSAVGPREAEATACGSKVFHVPNKREDYLGNRRELLKIFSNRDYPIVHAHLDGMNGYVLALAREAGVPVRISHCHNTEYLTTNLVRRLFHTAVKRRIPSVATHLFACSDAAARFFYGNRITDEGRVTVVKNAVETERFLFSKDAREQIRGELSIPGGAFVVGHAGRFEYQKNHAFLLEAFARLKRLRPESQLLLLGDGALRDAIISQISALGLEDSVRLLGYREGANRYYSAFDAFALPSRFEGLGIVLVEAQLSGLSCIASEAVPPDARVTDCTFLPLDATLWANRLLKCPIRNSGREVDLSLFCDAGYEIGTEAQKLQAFYEGLCV